MKINEVIRKYRKEQNLTQEQVGDYLGVSGPAVNKWERGISCPDISLLAPLARVLKIDVDTLLSFREELTDLEIVEFFNGISEEMMGEGYGTAFEKVAEKLREYPNSDKLMLYGAQILNGGLTMEITEIEGKEAYLSQINSWFERASLSGDSEVAQMASINLIQSLINNEDYEEAQEQLERLPKVSFDKRFIQANLYRKQRKYEDAYRINEEMLYQHISEIIGNMTHIITMLCQERKLEEALELAEKCETVANQFDMGDYVGKSAKLSVYLEMKDREGVFDTLEKMLDGLNDMNRINNSSLYKHMKFNPDDSWDKIKDVIIQGLEKDEEFKEFREDERFCELMER